MKSVRLEIEGLKDEETQVKVKDQLEGMIGVINTAISEDQSCMDVDFDENTTQSEIFSHLQNNGYKINT